MFSDRNVKVCSPAWFSLNCRNLKHFPSVERWLILGVLKTLYFLLEFCFGYLHYVCEVDNYFLRAENKRPNVGYQSDLFSYWKSFSFVAIYTLIFMLF